MRDPFECPNREHTILIALAYSVLFAFAVAAADTGRLPHFAQALHDLPFGDKVIHFTMYGMLALAANVALACRGRRSLARSIVMGSILVLVVATAEEYSNRFVPARDWSLGDLAANYLGILCLGILPLWRSQRFARSGEPAIDESFPPREAGAR